MLMNILRFFSIFLFVFNFSFAQSTDSSFSIRTDRGNTITFPYKINFTDAELKLLKSLDGVTLQKLTELAKLVQSQKKQSLYSVPTTTTPIFNTQAIPQILKQISPTNSSNSQNKPASYSGASGLNDTDPNSNPNFNPNNAPRDIQSLSPIDDSSVDFSKLPEGDNSRCGNFGVRGNMNNINNKVKFDTSCLCLAFGGPITMVSGFRNGDPRNHGRGLAIDIKENNYGNREKDAMFVVMLIALRYNVGSYHPGFGSFHADRANVNRWQTWSGVAHTNYQGGYARNYYQQIQDALKLIGKPAVSAAQLTAIGRPTTDQISAAATAVIEAKGSETMKKCLKASNI